MKSPRALIATAAIVAILAGCDIPTEPPIIEQRWMIEVDETSISVDELLPSAVTVVGSDFEVAVDPVSGLETLGVLCGNACDAVDGMVAPVPAFEGAFTSTQTLPSDVLAAALSGGSIEIAIANNLSFDPLYDGGTIVISIADDATGTSLGQIMLDGSLDVLVPGTSEVRTLVLSAGDVSGALRATTTVDAPGGQLAPIDVSDFIEVTATVASMLLSSVTVDVGSRSVSFDEQALDLEDLDSDLTDRIVSGAVILDVTNPFGVAIDGTVEIGATSKAFSIDGGSSSTSTLSYTGDELRSFMGQPNITFSGSGIANGTAVTIAPGQEMAVRATLDFTLEIG
jgi:hypothetical protein